ncbi:MAG: 50S ribosomal protein L18 [Tepidisphaerales bacterium]
MADKNIDKAKRFQRRKYSVRKGLFGTVERPRLSVYRSSKHIYAQVVDDMAGRTLAFVGSSKDVLGGLKNGGNLAAAKVVGKAIAEKAIAAGVKQVCFDRGGRMYHGRVKALADAARAAGLKF